MRKIILLLSIIILSGCSVDYTLTIDDDTSLENIVANEENFNSEFIPAYYNDSGPSESVGNEDLNFENEDMEFYKINRQNNYVILKYSFPKTNFINSTATHQCLKNINLTTLSNGNQMLNTSNYFSCFNTYSNLDEININLNFSNNYEVINSNADLKNNNSLTWNINKNNYNNKFIQVEYKKKEEEKEPIKEPTNDTKPPQEKTSILTYILVIGAVLVFIVGTFGFIIYKSTN